MLHYWMIKNWSFPFSGPLFLQNFLDNLVEISSSEKELVEAWGSGILSMQNGERTKETFGLGVGKRWVNDPHFKKEKFIFRIEGL